MEKIPVNKHATMLCLDILIILGSIFLAIGLVKTGILEKIISSTQGIHFLESFISGMFFTTMFTTAPAIVALGTISQQSSIWTTAFFGACGAVVIDTSIFLFMKHKFSNHLSVYAQHARRTKFKHLFLKLKSHRWITLVIAIFIIASPLPDEVGVSLLGLSKIGSKAFLFFSFLSNFIGILIIGIIARAV